MSEAELDCGPRLQAIVFASLLVIIYVIYMSHNPSADGVVLSGVVGALMAIGGYYFRAAKEGSTGQ